MLKIFIKGIGMVGVFFALALTASAVNSSSITFPVAELGSCNSQQACKAYCDIQTNHEACINFAEKHSLIPAADKQKFEQHTEAIKNGGPGGCTTDTGCKAYCQDSTHAEECLQFAEEHNILPPDELKHAKQLSKNFSQAGFTGPGGCRTEADCRRYCEDRNHGEECLNFAEKNNLLSSEELGQARRFKPLMDAGKTPGGCKSKDACQSYCQEEGHQDVCFAFMEQYGSLSSQELTKIKTLRGQGGPGGCKSKTACASFCNQEQNHQECLSFAQEHDFINKEDAHNIEEGRNRVQAGIDNIPAEVKDCIQEQVDTQSLGQLEEGKLLPTSEIGEKIKSCFEKFKPQVQNQFNHELKTSPATATCLEQAVGKNTVEDIQKGEAPPNPEIAKKMRACFERESQHQQQSREQELAQPQSPEHQNNNSSPDIARVCLAELFGAAILKRNDLQEFQNKPEVSAKIQECIDSKLGNPSQHNNNARPQQQRQEPTENNRPPLERRSSAPPVPTKPESQEQPSEESPEPWYEPSPEENISADENDQVDEYGFVKTEGTAHIKGAYTTAPRPNIFIRILKFLFIRNR